MPWITRDDFIELRAKLQQRGWPYIMSKINPSAADRVRSTFGASSIHHANWWIVPGIRRRWNARITGNPEQRYEDYVIEKYLSGRQNLDMLSLGCGAGSHERYFAKRGPFRQVTGIDLADNLIREANRQAQEERLTNCRFRTADVHSLAAEDMACDVLLFHSSLHHFFGLDSLMRDQIPQMLRPGGLLVLNDYWGPNRLQWTPYQLTVINETLKKMPEEYRVRFQSRRIKRSVTGPGWWRMRLSDPSEAAEAERIKPFLRKHYHCLEEKSVGGNILMPLLKDIAHHFVADTPETNEVLAELCAAEDAFLDQEEVDPILFFGVYRPIAHRPG